MSREIDTALFLRGRNGRLRVEDSAFRRFFGPGSDIHRMVEAHEPPGCVLDSLRIAGRSDTEFESRATFRSVDGSVSGSVSNLWRRQPGEELRRADGAININGSRSRLALQLHANLVEFSRSTGCVKEFKVEARGVGRYAYRFIDGFCLDQATHAALSDAIGEHARRFASPFDPEAFALAKSPLAVVDFLVLPRIPERWMAVVDEIIDRQGYGFTVDQVVDVARRPGLACLIDRPSYWLTLDLFDEQVYRRFRRSIVLGRSDRAVRRLRGVLGSPFSLMPNRARSALITCRPYLFPRPKEIPRIPDFTAVDVPCSPYRVRGFWTTDGVFLEAEEADPPGVSSAGYRQQEVERCVRAIDRGRPLVSVTGLSGSGKTEVLIWNLERELSELGHRVVSLDAMQLLCRDHLDALLREIEEAVRPTVMVFDESLYIRGPTKQVVVDFIQRFLAWPGQSVVLIGGGRTSPGRQQEELAVELEELWGRYKVVPVALLPKALNLNQAYRFLGFGRLRWLNQDKKLALLRYILERYPPFFIPLMPIRLHEHPEVTDVAAARALIDAQIAPEEWRDWTGMEFELQTQA